MLFAKECHNSRHEEIADIMIAYKSLETIMNRNMTLPSSPTENAALPLAQHIRARLEQFTTTAASSLLPALKAAPNTVSLTMDPGMFAQVARIACSAALLGVDSPISSEYQLHPSLVDLIQRSGPGWELLPAISGCI